MSEVKKRKFYSSEFMAKVGLEALRGLKTINEIGQEFSRALSGIRHLAPPDCGSGSKCLKSSGSIKGVCVKG